MGAWKLALIGATVGLSTWAVILGMRLNPITRAVRAPQSQQVLALEAVPVDAAQIYETTCASCHQSAGQGRYPVFPPLAGSPWVVGDATRLVSLTLHGMSGPLKVNEVAYDGLMPAFDHLSDEELAKVLSYIRQSWGNNASELSETDIAAVRVATSKRQRPWTAAELDETSGAAQ